LRLSWTYPDHADIGRWVVYYKYGPQWNQHIHGSTITEDAIPAFTLNRTYLARTSRDKVTKADQAFTSLDSVAVSAVDRFGNESGISRMGVNEFTLADAPDLDKSLAEFYEGMKRPPVPVPAVTPGINVLLDEHPDLIRGKRVGLITNPSAVGIDMRSTVDILA